MVEDHITNIEKWRNPFVKYFFLYRFVILVGFWVLSWWTSLLCIMGELAGGGSMAMAVGVGVRWQMKRDMWKDYLLERGWGLRQGIFLVLVSLSGHFGALSFSRIPVYSRINNIVLINISILFGTLRLGLGAYYSGPTFKFQPTSGTG